jgi:hypothetical protein
MKKIPSLMRLKTWLMLASGILLASVAYLHLLVQGSKRLVAPTLPLVSNCKTPNADMKRIGDGYGLQFDIPTKLITLHEGVSDTVPVVHGFGLRPKDSSSLLEISFGNHSTQGFAVDPAPVFSARVEKRNIVDDRGHPIGEDYWGVLGSGERWRQVRISGGGVARYGFVNKKDADVFDRVIGSACFLPAPNP